MSATPGPDAVSNTTSSSTDSRENQDWGLTGRSGSTSGMKSAARKAALPWGVSTTRRESKRTTTASAARARRANLSMRRPQPILVPANQTRITSSVVRDQPPHAAPQSEHEVAPGTTFAPQPHQSSHPRLSPGGGGTPNPAASIIAWVIFMTSTASCPEFRGSVSALTQSIKWRIWAATVSTGGSPSTTCPSRMMRPLPLLV